MNNAAHSSLTSSSVAEPLAAAPSRRRFLTVVGAGALTVGLAMLTGQQPAEAKKKHGKGKGKKGGKGKGKDGGGGGGGGTSNPPSPPPPASVEEQLLALINADRDDNGQAPLTWDDRLGEAAQKHSDDMASKGYFDHTSPNGSSPRDRMTDAGYPENVYWGENIFQSTPNDPSAQAAFTSWKNSPGHNANMLGPNFTRIGLGQTTNSARATLWTAVFASLPN